MMILCKLSQLYGFNKDEEYFLVYSVLSIRLDFKFCWFLINYDVRDEIVEGVTRRWFSSNYTSLIIWSLIRWF